MLIIVLYEVINSEYLIIDIILHHYLHFSNSITDHPYELTFVTVYNSSCNDDSDTGSKVNYSYIILYKYHLLYYTEFNASANITILS